MSQIIFRHYQLEFKWWDNFCRGVRFDSYEETNEYLSQFNAEWVGKAEGNYLIFADEAGFSMFVLRWS